VHLLEVSRGRDAQVQPPDEQGDLELVDHLDLVNTKDPPARVPIRRNLEREQELDPRGVVTMDSGTHQASTAGVAKTQITPALNRSAHIDLRRCCRDRLYSVGRSFGIHESESAPNPVHSTRAVTRRAAGRHLNGHPAHLGKRPGPVGVSVLTDQSASRPASGATGDEGRLWRVRATAEGPVQWRSGGLEQIVNRHHFSDAAPLREHCGNPGW